MKIAVLGAGPTGIMAARDLARSGHSVTVYEASGQVGGMAGSFDVAGQRVDYGSHRLHPASPPQLLDEIRRLLGSDLQERPRKGRINLLGRWIGFPLRAADLARRLPPRFALGAALDTAMGPLRRPRHSSFDAAIRSGLGSTVADHFYGPYAVKLYGLPPTELTAELARRRVSASTGGAIVKRIAKAARGDAPTFLYPRTGYGAIVEHLAEDAAAAGVEIQLDAPVEAVEDRGSGVAVTASQARSEFDVAVSTMPLPRLAHALGHQPDDVTEALAATRVRAMILVYLVIPRDRYTEFDAHYLPAVEQRVARLSEPKNYRSGPDPDGQTVLCAEIPCWVSDDLWQWTEADLGSLVTDELQSLGLPDPAHVAVETRRLSSVYPVLDRATVAERSRVLEWSQDLGNVIVTGRQGHSVFDNLHHVFSMGQQVAACFGPDGFDRPMWERATADFDDHVVED